MNVESYMHLHAKQVLAGWLRSAAERSDENGFITDADSSVWPYWRVNRGPPHYGVWEEYPITVHAGLSPVWDESYWPWYLSAGVNFDQNLPGDMIEIMDGCSGPVSISYLEKKQNQSPPTYDECLKIGVKPEVIFDIAIQHKGAIVTAFEIVHKHDISQSKMEKLKILCPGHGIEVYRVPASWVMGQISEPKYFAGERVV